jgi:phosphohistidine phosphatase SixA
MIKKLSLISLLLLVMACGSDKEEPRQLLTPDGKTPAVTSYYLIRHAEKLRDSSYNGNPTLSEKGLERSKYWGEYFEDKALDLFYTTDYLRTFQTLIPVVYPYKGEIQFYEPKDTMFTEQFWSDTYGKNTIIVGHSNTTPKFVNQIIGKNKYKSIPDTINYRVYNVQISKEGFIVKDTFENVLLRP